MDFCKAMPSLLLDTYSAMEIVYLFTTSVIESFNQMKISRDLIFDFSTI